MEKTLLLISTNPEDKEFAETVAATAGLNFRPFPDAKEAMGYFSSTADQVHIFVDASNDSLYTDFEFAVESAIGLFSDKINVNYIHFISSEDVHMLGKLVQSPLFGNFIFRNYGSPKEAGAHYGRIVKTALSERIFGLKNMVSPEAKVQNLKLQFSNQKLDAVEAVKKYLLAAKFPTRMASVIATAVDELIMNACFAAPTDELGKPLYNSTARTHVIELKDRNSVELFISFDGAYIAVTAVDLFGSIDKGKLLTHVSKIYVGEEYKIKTTVAGAGLGLATTYRSGGSFIFATESGTRTEVTVFFRKFDSYRQFRDQFRFIMTQFYF